MKRYVFFLLLLLSLADGFAQTGGLKFNHFTQQTGLPDQQIQFVKQDDQGYIWIGTLLGLVRYDGYKLKVYAMNGKKTDVFMRSMIADEHQDLWFSTYSAFGAEGGALFKYDRSSDSFTRFPYNMVRNGQVLLKFADDKGNLWGYADEVDMRAAGYGVQARVARFDPKTKTYAYPGVDQHARTLASAYLALFKSKVPGDNIWMGNLSGLYLFSYKDNVFHPFMVAKDSAAAQSIKNMYEAPSEPGVLWMNVFDHASKHMLIERLDSRTKATRYYSHFNTPGLTAANDSVASYFEDSHHQLWFGTKNGLLLYNSQSQTLTPFVMPDAVRSADKSPIFRIAEAKDGRLWLVSFATLLSFDPKTHLFQYYRGDLKDEEGLNLANFADLSFDNNGTMWLGDFASGVDKLNAISSAFNIYPIDVHDGSADQLGFTNNTAATADGNYWFSNDEGVFKWKPGPGKPIKIYTKKKTDGGLDGLFTGKDGKVYFSNQGGLQIIDPDGKQESYSSNPKDSSSIGYNTMNRILQDHTGTVWLGTTNVGVNTFDPATKKFTRYPFINQSNLVKSNGKLDGFVVDCILEDSGGTIWLSTHLGGLNRFDRKTGKFTSYYLDGKTNVYTVTHLLEGRDGHIWVGTYSLGLFEFDPKTGHYIRHINEESGLLYNTVTGIEQDEEGYLWVASVRGLTRIDPKSMAMKTFLLNDILPGRSLNSDYNLTKVNNQLILSMTNGVAIFNPHDLDGNAVPPVVHIEKISYSDPASATDSVTAKIAFGTHEIELPHNQNRIIFNYIALHYANPAQNKYAYRLDGYDNHWVQAGTQRSVTYTNLAPGTYTFHVKAANSDGIWNDKGDSITIIIHSPWWQTWWAWLLYIITFSAAVYAFIAYRSRKLLHDNRVLEHKVHVRTEEVMQQKEEIEAQRDSLEQAFSDLKATQSQLVQREKMASLGELTAGIAHEIQNPLNFVNNFSEVNTELIEEMEEEIDKGNLDEVKAIAVDIKGNQQKISQHGKRADFIVKGMLQHSRTSTGEKQPTDLNILADEFFKLSYHGLRAKDKNFNADLATHFDPKLPKINIAQQDIGRVLLNLFNNAFYAVNEKLKTAAPGYKPTVEVTTAQQNGSVIISVKDNGTGIPDNIREKIMQPFFTTKPTGEGTGLGLSLSYDIVVKGHGGKVSVESKEGEGSEFTVTLPIS